METPRRRFLRLVAAVGGIGALNALGASCAPYEGTPTGPGNPGGGGGGTFEVDLTAYPALASDNTVVVVSGTPVGSIFLTHTTGSTYYALSRTCTHQGCTVGTTTPTLNCPCHGSKYALNGSVVMGPAPRALTSWPVTKDGEILTIDFG